MPVIRRYIENGYNCKDYYDEDVGFFTTRLPVKRKQNLRFVWLSEMIKKHKFRTGVEIGVGKGINFFRYLRECPGLKMLVGIDPWKEQPSNKGPNQFIHPRWRHAARFNHARRNLSMFPGRCRIIRDFSHNAVLQFEDGTFDFVFIDGDHGYKSTRQDIELWKPKVRPGGLLSGHDINWLSVRRAVEDTLPSFEFNPKMDNVWWYWRSNVKSDEEPIGVGAT